MKSTSPSFLPYAKMSSPDLMAFMTRRVCFFSPRPITPFILRAQVLRQGWGVPGELAWPCWSAGGRE